MCEIPKLQIDTLGENALRKSASSNLARHFAQLTPVPGRGTYFDHANQRYLVMLIPPEGVLAHEFAHMPCLIFPVPDCPDKIAGEERAKVMAGLQALQGREDLDEVKNMLQLLFASAGWADSFDESRLELVH